MEFWNVCRSVISSLEDSSNVVYDAPPTSTTFPQILEAIIGNT